MGQLRRAVHCSDCALDGPYELLGIQPPEQPGGLGVPVDPVDQTRGVGGHLRGEDNMSKTAPSQRANQLKPSVGPGLSRLTRPCGEQGAGGPRGPADRETHADSEVGGVELRVMFIFQRVINSIAFPNQVMVSTENSGIDFGHV